MGYLVLDFNVLFPPQASMKWPGQLLVRRWEADRRLSESLETLADVMSDLSRACGVSI